ncbi:MAG: DNA cytosine methyltransferase [Pseudomonadota bacterium]
MKVSGSKYARKDSDFSPSFTFLDVFAGCGGLSLGLMQAGWQGLFAVEHDANAFQTLHDNLIEADARFRFAWPDWLPKVSTDVADLLKTQRQRLATYAGKVDMLVGGPPCQGFSSAGKRNPNDPRNRLVEQYLDFVHLLKPRVVLIENVRGITADFDDSATDGGKVNYAQWIIKALGEDYDVSTKMIDTSFFGVPQKRHRFFIVGFRAGSGIDSLQFFDGLERDRQSFLRRKGISNVPVSSKAAISDLEVSRNGKIPSRDNAGFHDIAYKGPSTAYQTLMNDGWKGIPPDTRLARHRPDITARFAKIIDLCHADGRLNVSLSSEMKASFGLKKSAIRVLDPNSPSPTVTSMPDDLIHYSEPRALCVRENARLQSFPDWFAFKGKYTTGGERRKLEVPRFTQVANAVPPLVAEAIGLSIAKLLSETKHYKAGVTEKPHPKVLETLEAQP